MTCNISKPFLLLINKLFTFMKKITQFFIAVATMFALGNVAVMAQPVVSAPTPPARSAAKVISIFSDA